MDLSWCIICDRHCIEDNLYCSELCRLKDNNTITIAKPNTTHSTGFCSPPASPLLEPFLSSFNHERRTSIVTTGKSNISNPFYMSPSSIPKYSLTS
ncbi:hypothetical protein RO3G_13411 [Rhizopus delemar RA 99-880]|uniref:Uncharacterized protein n=1 Tax=Rhizopus delemar (strain RA 99-880 / ATCC MYA-4621 / FGSC 9543 / NRRL 43880) TaxID=246409 RepID=I1CJS0_RHIO9|nr:hypothetical protein RO3G_13411 [Rhizopus delemar RA 99-880]|eukprot:EIE88700.1 hypothetical protein RO3G_13411 [Rhizopus delemar RA 99-880]